MNTRCGRGGSARMRPGARAVLGAALAVGTAGGIVGVFGAGPAGAVPVSLDLQYTCTFPVINDQPVAVKINADMAKSHTVGQPTPNYVVDAVATVGADTTQALNEVGAKTLEGTADAKARLDAPQGDTDLTVAFNMSKTTVPASGSFDIPATGIVPSVTFTQPGSGQVIVGDLVLHLVARNADGNQITPSRFDAPCTLDVGQNNVLLSFGIIGPGATTGSTTSGTTGPTASGTSGSAAGTVSGTAPGTSASAAGTVSGTAPGTSASAAGTPSGTSPGDAASATTGSITGDSAHRLGSESTSGDWHTADLILLVAGSLVAGAAALHFGSRLLNRRRAGHDT